MSYPMDLDEYTEHALVAEILRRKQLFDDGRCTYCKQPRTFALPPVKRDGTWHQSLSCKDRERHMVPLDGAGYEARYLALLFPDEEKQDAHSDTASDQR